MKIDTYPTSLITIKFSLTVPGHALEQGLKNHAKGK